MALRWGVVTAGKISHDFVTSVQSYPNKGDQTFVAVAARDLERARKFASTHTIPKVFNSYEAMAECPDINIVYIGALNPDHYRLVKLYLENGKHVLCEKPLCLNYKQAESLIKFAKSKNLFLMEAVWSRFAPSYLALEREIASGNLGDVKYVNVTFGVPIVSVPRLRSKELGGSAILDIGVYVLQFAQFIFKEEPKKVSAIGKLNDDGVDIIDTVVLEYDNDRLAVLHVNAMLKLPNDATVVGTKGKATLQDPFHFPLKLIKADETVQKFTLHYSKLDYNFENSAGLVYQTLEVAKCIKDGLLESPRMPHKETLTLAKLMETVRKQVGVHYDVDDEELP